MATKKTSKSTKKTTKGTKKAAKRAKTTAKRPTRRGKVAPRTEANVYKLTESNLEVLTNAGVINANWESFTPGDITAINNLSSGEVDVLIQVFNDLGVSFFERNTPNGFVF
jgi:hypothetical protein